MKITAAIIILLMLTTGCATRPKPVPDLEYRKIPEAYLQECQLPAAPLTNAELSDAFAQAYQCGQQGNRDKQRIRDLTAPITET